MYPCTHSPQWKWNNMFWTLITPLSGCSLTFYMPFCSRSYLPILKQITSVRYSLGSIITFKNNSETKPRFTHFKDKIANSANVSYFNIFFVLYNWFNLLIIFSAEIFIFSVRDDHHTHLPLLRNYWKLTLFNLHVGRNRQLHWNYYCKRC